MRGNKRRKDKTGRRAMANNNVGLKSNVGGVYTRAAQARGAPT